ncbi:hypothetical protein LCGC14_0275180 [marine sediment metagenome]|uniref:Uncharacterized protein n=1 Tax=marine sediment metagenome TaxID=412755 RepID=A0A0F9X2L9_9ZZZZ
MSRILNTGVEPGHIGVFSVNDGGAVTSTGADVRTGGYALDINCAGNNHSNHEFEVPVAETYTRFYIKFDDRTQAASILSFEDDVGNPQIRVLATGEVDRWDGAAWDNLGDFGGFAADDTWYRFEIRQAITTSQIYLDGVVVVKIDGVTVLNLSNVNNNGGNFGTDFTMAVAVFGNQDGATSANHIFYDDLGINDVFNGVNDAWLGIGAVYGLRPDDVGNYSQFTPFPNSGEDNYEDVDEVPPDDDTSYVFSTGYGQIDTYEFEDLADLGISALSLIAAVTWQIRAKVPIAGSANISAMYRYGNTFDYQGSAMEVSSTDYVYLSHIEDEDPVIGGTWLADSIDNSQFGIKQPV